MTDDVTASAETLMRQASMTAEDYLREAVRRIDAIFGAGYAKAHPDLLAAFMRTAAQDFHTAMVRVAAQDIRDGLHAIAALLGSDDDETI